MVRAICEMKLSNIFLTKSLINSLDLREMLEILAKASGVRWFGHVMRRDEENVLRDTNLKEMIKKEAWPRIKWKSKILSKLILVGLKEHDGSPRKKWSLGVYKIA